MSVYNYTVHHSVISCRVEEADLERLFKDKERLDREAFTRIALEFSVNGQDEGTYSAIVHESSGMFYLDAVYRQQDIKNRARIDISLAGRFSKVTYFFLKATIMISIL